MKVKALLAAAAALVLTVTSCGILAPAQSDANSTSETAAITTGTKVGSALLGLYTQYKTTGKIDLSNATNLLNLATLASNLGGLKSAYTTADTATANTFADLFSSSLISGSANLVNASNQSSVVGTLLNLSNIDLSAITGQAKTTASSAAAAATSALTSPELKSAVSSLTTLFKTMK